MKGQLIPVVFVVLLVAGALIGYIFYNIFYGTRYQAQVFQISTIDAVRNLIENFKNYIKLSLTYSSHQSLREHACLSGLVDARPWICNGPNPVSVKDSKDCLGDYTKYYLSVYTDLFNTSLPVQLTKSSFVNCFYDVSENDVFSRKYDEGDFWVNCSEAKVAISGEEINEYENIKIDDFITKNRYWYMYRIFYDWAMADIYSPCICSKIGCACSSSLGEETCADSCLRETERCAQTALEDLQQRFDLLDNHVKCEKRRICCAQGRGPSCGLQCGCQDWTNRICISHCTHECPEPPPTEKLCPIDKSQSYITFPETKFIYDSTPNVTEYSTSEDPLSCCCKFWYEARLASAYEFKCIDYKYYVPSEKGPIPLTFIVNAYAYWKNPCACMTENRCSCPDEAESCAECGNVCCTQCYSC